MAVAVTDNQYLVLMSNVRSATGENINTSSEYTNDLATHVQLTGNHRVGIASMVLPKKWCNVAEGSDWIEVREFRGSHVEVSRDIGYEAPIEVEFPTLEASQLTGDGKISVHRFVDYVNRNIPTTMRDCFKVEYVREVPEEQKHRLRFAILRHSKVKFNELWERLGWKTGYTREPREKTFTFNFPTQFRVPTGLKLSLEKYYNRAVTQYIEHVSESYRLGIKHGKYTSDEELIKAIKDAFSHLDQSHFIRSLEIELKQAENTKVFSIKTSADTQIWIPERLGVLLGGFPSNQWLARSTEHKSERAMDLENDGVSAFIVYCNLVQYSFIGNMMGPMIAIVMPEQTSATDIQLYIPPNIHYYNSNTNFFKSVKIYIRDQSGNPIEFIGGLSMVKLHILLH